GTRKDGNGSTLTGRTVTWSTSASGVATVSASGLVSAVAAGSATITATSEGKSGSATVTVPAPLPTVTNPGTVSDLKVAAVTDTSVTLAFTEEDDGSGTAATDDIRSRAVTPLDK